MTRRNELRRRAADSRGQSLVEFALISLALIMLLFGVIEISRLMLVYTTISNAARVGVRYATVHGYNDPATVSTIQGVVNGYLSAATVYTGNSTVNVCYSSSISCTASSSDCTGTNSACYPGQPVTVYVSYPYNPITSYFPISVTLKSASQGVIAF